jgi:transposase
VAAGDQEGAWQRLSAEMDRLRVELASLRTELVAERAGAAEKAARLEELTRLQSTERAAAVDKITKLEAELRLLRRQVFGPKSEKIPTLEAELRKTDGERVDPAAIQQTRQANAQSREPSRRREILHRVPSERRLCPSCGILLLAQGDGWLPLQPLIEYVGEDFERQDHKLEVLACPDCGHVETARSPQRVIDGGRYGPAFFAFLIVAKCGDSIPIYRLQTRFRRLGIPVARSTMNDLVHAAAKLLEPIHKRMLELIRASAIVLADETSMRVQKRKKRGFVWTFSAPIFDTEGRTLQWIKAYTFSPSRSGDTPKEVLGGSRGYLVVDMFTGYNSVTKVDGRRRGACNAHARRGFYEAMSTAPEAMKALEFYLDAFRVEREAKTLGIEGTAAHLELRQTKSQGIMDRFKVWLEQEQPRHMPKGPMGLAIKYALDHWTDLTLFLTDARIPFTNNLSEGNLRTVALGRKNYLHFGTDTAGKNFAILYSIVMSCEANGVNPLEYLKDVLIRVHTHPASKIDELLPHTWRRTPDGGDGPQGGGYSPSSSAEDAGESAEATAPVDASTAASDASTPGIEPDAPPANLAGATDVIAAVEPSPQRSPPVKTDLDGQRCARPHSRSPSLSRRFRCSALRARDGPRHPSSDPEPAAGLQRTRPGRALVVTAGGTHTLSTKI